MKFILLFIALMLVFPATTHAQLLKGLGKKIEQKIENRIDRKVDRSIEGALDKAEQAGDKAMNDAVETSAKSAAENRAAKSINKESIRNNKAYKELKLETVEVRPDESMTLIQGACGNFLWFSKGGMMEYTVKGEGDDFKNRMHVKNVRNEGAKTIADLEGEVEINGKVQKMDFKYVCDGEKVYLDMGDVLKSVVAQNPELEQYMKQSEQQVEIDLDNGYTQFPSKLYKGQQLEDVSFNVNTGVGGIASVKFGSDMLDRLVMGKEKVETPAGTFECMKIRSVNVSSYDIMGHKKILPPQVQYLWIAPKVGMVKQESYNGNKLVSSMILNNYKM